MKHWNLQYVLNNIEQCNSIYRKIRKLPSVITEQANIENYQKMIGT